MRVRRHAWDGLGGAGLNGAGEWEEVASSEERVAAADASVLGRGVYLCSTDALLQRRYRWRPCWRSCNVPIPAKYFAGPARDAKTIEAALGA
jgi:hypothetical protein